MLTLAIVPLTSFVPLFMQEVVGLNAASVVWLQTGYTIRGHAVELRLGLGYRPLWEPTSYIKRRLSCASWSPSCSFSCRNSQAGASMRHLPSHFLQGVADMGWGIGSANMLYVSVVPAKQKRDYMAVYAAWIGIVGGISQLAGGWILQFSQDAFRATSSSLRSIHISPSFCSPCCYLSPV